MGRAVSFQRPCFCNFLLLKDPFWRPSVSLDTCEPVAGQTVCVPCFCLSYQPAVRGCGELKEDEDGQPLAFQLHGGSQAVQVQSPARLCRKNSGRVVRSRRPGR